MSVCCDHLQPQNKEVVRTLFFGWLISHRIQKQHIFNIFNERRKKEVESSLVQSKVTSCYTSLHKAQSKHLQIFSDFYVQFNLKWTYHAFGY